MAGKCKNNPNIRDSCEFYSPEHWESVGVLPAGVQAGKQVERQEDLHLPDPLMVRVGSRKFRWWWGGGAIKARPNGQDRFS